MASKHRRTHHEQPKQRPTQILIGMTSLYGEVSTFAVSSLLKLCVTLKQNDIRYKYCCVDSPYIERNYNVIASNCLHDQAITHLLLVDSKILFDAECVIALLAQRRPISSFEALTDSYGLKDLYDSAGLPDSADADPKDGGGFRSASFSNLGLALIERRVLQTMVERRIVSRYLDSDDFSEHTATHSPAIYGFFSPLIEGAGDRADRWQSAFCTRWASISGESLWTSDASFPFVGKVAIRTSFSNRMTA